MMTVFGSILLVEDDNITNFINERLLKQMDIASEILVAQNGQEALNLIRKLNTQDKKCPELILLDLKMPVMDGFEFLEEYEKVFCQGKEEVNIIVLTTSTNKEDLKRLEKIGYTKVLNKPLTREKLEPFIEEYLESKTA